MIIFSVAAMAGTSNQAKISTPTLNARERQTKTPKRSSSCLPNREPTMAENQGESTAVDHGDKSDIQELGWTWARTWTHLLWSPDQDHPTASTVASTDPTVSSDPTDTFEHLGLEMAYEITIDGIPVFEHAHQARESTTESSEDKTAYRKPCRSYLDTAVIVVKNIFSAALLGFCIVMLSAAIFEKQTTATAEYDLHPSVAFVVFWVLLLWLALMEGGLNCMVGLKPVTKALYAESHPLALRCTRVVHKGDNLDRFIVGRQYLDLSIVFTTNFMVSSIANATVLGLSQGICETFLSSGLAVILITIVIGQLTAQINSAHYMLDFINNYLMVVTTYVALFVEASGILHAVYLIQIIVSSLAGRKTNSEHKTTFQKATFWLRVAFSVALLIFAFAITVKALFDKSTTMWSSVPAWASLIILLLLTLIAGIMEGLQIALMAVVHISEDELKHHPRAYSNYDFIFSGKHLQSFLVGRQICQTIIMFVVARIITLDAESENIFGVPDRLQQFFVTGVLGALMTTIVASLSWRVLAASFPVAFLSNPFSRPIIHLCLIFEYTGICYIAWPIAKLYRQVFRFKKDDYYIGTVEERWQKGERGDSDLALTEPAVDCSEDDNV